MDKDSILNHEGGSAKKQFPLIHVDLHDDLQYRWFTEALATCGELSNQLSEYNSQFIQDLFIKHQQYKRNLHISRKQFAYLRQLAHELKNR